MMDFRIIAIVIAVGAVASWAVINFVIPYFSERGSGIVREHTPARDVRTIRSPRISQDTTSGMRVGSKWKFDPTGAHSATGFGYTVLGTAELLVQKHIQGSQFSPTGQSYKMALLGDDVASSVLVLERPEGKFVFTSQELLPDNAAQQFNKAGLDFVNNHAQQPRSVSIEWQGASWPILSLGYEAVSNTRGDLHIPDGMNVKYLIVESPDRGQAMYVENCMTGEDRLWTGSFIGPTTDNYLFATE